MHRYSAVLFDFDGTVAYTAKDVWNSVAYGFARYGLALPRDYASDDRNLAYLVPDMVAELYPGTPASLGKRIEDAVAYHYRCLNTYPDTYLYPNMDRILELLLAREIPTGILSNKNNFSLGRILKEKGWGRYFTSYRGTLDTDADTTGKTERLADYMKQFDTADAIYIGDSAGDVEAAKANGLRSVGVLYGDGDKQLVIKSKPDVLCETTKELLQYLMEG